MWKITQKNVNFDANTNKTTKSDTKDFQNSIWNDQKSVHPKEDPYVPYVERRNKLIEKFKTMFNGVHPFAQNAKQEKDAPYAYYNKNDAGKTGDSPVADIYALNTIPSYKYQSDGTNSRKEVHTGLERGQKQIDGNDTSPANTLIAYLTNDNPKTTCFIGNITPEELANNFLNSADNIHTGDMPDMVDRDKNGDFIIPCSNNPSKSAEKEVPMTNLLTPGDGEINKLERETTKIAYVLDAEIDDAKSQINPKNKPRNSAVSTVNLDRDDPYDQFFNKVIDLNKNKAIQRQASRLIEFEKKEKVEKEAFLKQYEGNPSEYKIQSNKYNRKIAEVRRANFDKQNTLGVTKKELTDAITAISVKKDGGLYFDNEKLKAYLNQ